MNKNGQFLCVIMLWCCIENCWNVRGMDGTTPGAMTHQSRVVFKLSLRQLGRVRLGLGTRDSYQTLIKGLEKIMQISSSKYNFIVPHQSNLINSKRLHMFFSFIESGNQRLQKWTWLSIRPSPRKDLRHREAKFLRDLFRVF